MRSADVDDDGDDCLGVVDFPAGPPRRGRCELSNFYFTACRGQRIALPKHALYRVGTPLRRWHRPTPCDCARGALCSRGWPPIAWEHVTVVVALDNCGQRAAGWFVQFRGAGASPLELVRLPTGVAAQLLDELPLESDAWQHPDVATQKPWADFEALAVARYRSLVPPGRAVAQRTRSQPPSPPPPVPSRWEIFALPRAPKGQRDGDCVVCFEAGTLFVPSCCGTSAAVCARCNATTRGVCIVCQRSWLAGLYVCTCCGSNDVPIDKYGHACAVCEGRTLCVDCADAHAACAACDPLRA